MLNIYSYEKFFFFKKLSYSIDFVGFSSVFLAVFYFNFKNNSVDTIPAIILLAVSGFIIWVLLDTRYVIKNNNLYYRSGPFRGRLGIEKINKIEYYSGYNVPTTFKPALDYKGYLIFFGKFESIYVSPKNATEFINELMKINPNIEVVQ